jgi:hypothetical protein
MPAIGASIMKVLRRDRAKTEYQEETLDERHRVLAATAASLVEGAAHACISLRRRWAEKARKDEAAIPQPWSIQVELLWFLLSALMRKALRFPTLSSDARRLISVELPGAVIDKILDSSSLARKYQHNRERLIRKLELWRRDAEESYKGTVGILPSADETSLKDNLCGRAAFRMAKAMGRPDDIPFATELATWIVESYIEIEVPRMATVCIGAYGDPLVDT